MYRHKEEMRNKSVLLFQVNIKIIHNFRDRCDNQSVQYSFTDLGWGEKKSILDENTSIHDHLMEHATVECAMNLNIHKSYTFSLCLVEVYPAIFAVANTTGVLRYYKGIASGPRYTN